MNTKLINNGGSGSFDGPSLISYSLSEDVTTLNPANVDGGIGQIDVRVLSVEGDKVGDTHPDSKLLINNSMTLSDQDSGDITFSVKRVSVSEGVASIIGDSIASRLNVIRTAPPHGGEGSSLLTAIIEYCGLVDISIANGNLVFEDGIDEVLDDVAVNFIGWSGNVWEHLKMLASAVPLSETDNTGFEFHIADDALAVRAAKTLTLDVAKNAVISRSVEIDSFDAAQTVNIINYNTSYAADQVIQDVSIDKSKIGADAQNVFCNDSFQVNAGETITKRFTINASLETVNQPVAVDAILPFPYPSIGELGQYAIAGADNIFIKADQWVGEGGSLTVSLTENPREVEVTITAPPMQSLENINGGGELSFEPYKVAVETSGLADYPALYITGTGVFYNAVSHKIYTGASNEYTADIRATDIDNPFITNKSWLYSRGVVAAQSLCGPNVKLSESLSSNEPFGETPGKMRELDSNKYRITSVSYSAEETSITASPCASFTDFNAKWTGLTFEDFDNTALDPAEFPAEALKFNEFTIIPLMDPEVI